MKREAPHSPAYHHGDLRAALIQAGREILEEGGPRVLTLRGAAKRAGVSHAAPGHHFPSLAHFLGDCAADGFMEFTAALQAAQQAGRDPVDALCKMGEAYVRFALRHRAMFRLMFDRDSFGERTELLAMHGDRAYATLVAAVAAVAPMKAPGAATAPQDLEFHVASVWAIVHGYASLTLENHVCTGEGAEHGQWAARTVRIYLEGIRGA